MAYAERPENPLQANITFVITEDCNLRCKYCYEENKQKNKISLDVVRKAVKHIKKNYIKFDSVVWDFIGGEPLMEPELIEGTINIIREEFAGHKWMEKELYSVTTNGTLFGNEKVKNLLDKYPQIQVGLSLDGIKIVHDLNRSDSFDVVMKHFKYWKDKYPYQSTKSTINREALPYVFDSFVFLTKNLGLKTINMNCVYEDVWQEGDDLIFREQLLKIADYLLTSGRYQCVNTNLFPTSMKPDFIKACKTRKESGIVEKRSWCGSGTCMLAVAPDGGFYPCMRFFTASAKGQYNIGNVDDGLDTARVLPFFFTNKQTSDKCSDCEYLDYCPHCLAWDYEQTGTLFKRATHACEMLKAQFEVAKYYYSAKTESKDEKEFREFMASTGYVLTVNKEGKTVYQKEYQG